MFNAQSVITNVMQGNYPPDWHVYYGQEYNGCLFFWTSGRSFTLVILPQGVVKWVVEEEEAYSWLYFPQIDRIQLAQETQIYGVDGDISSNTDYWLDVYCRNGTYLKWWIEGFFDDAASIGKSIIAAHSYYWQHHRFIP